MAAHGVKVAVRSCIAAAAGTQPLSHALNLHLAIVLSWLGSVSFVLLEGIVCRSVNRVHAPFLFVMRMSVIFVLFWMFGFALMMGESLGGFVGSSSFLVDFASQHENSASNFLSYCVKVVRFGAILGGAGIDRISPSCNVVLLAIIAVLAFCIPAHWVLASHGWLRKQGFVDPGAATLIHASAGAAGCTIIALAGPRISHRAFRFKADVQGRQLKRKWTKVRGLFLQDDPIVAMWSGLTVLFQAVVSALLDAAHQDLDSFALSSGVFRVVLAASSGFVAGMGFSVLWKKSIRGTECVFGMITAEVALVSLSAATLVETIVFGLLAGLFGLVVADLLASRTNFDDPLRLLSTHLLCGGFGTLSLSKFDSATVVHCDGTFANHAQAPTLRAQTLGLLTVCAWSSLVAFGACMFARLCGCPLRSSCTEQIVGGDIVAHGVQPLNALDAQQAPGLLVKRLIVTGMLTLAVSDQPKRTLVTAASSRKTLLTETDGTLPGTSSKRSATSHQTSSRRSDRSRTGLSAASNKVAPAKPNLSRRVSPEGFTGGSQEAPSLWRPERLRGAWEAPNSDSVSRHRSRLRRSSTCGSTKSNSMAPAPLLRAATATKPDFDESES
ncbi:Putative ammonium transporter sll0108 [Durusdinium trenchii]|uniref:Ammonium transporter sll0108 n=1 Tax=Durusdinium trenchii TaxID=1381693 RepID=A0ABP0RM71_9DINO